MSSNKEVVSVALDKFGLGVLVYSYAVVMGAAYLLAFWRPLGLEIFTYLSLTDFVTAPLDRISVLLSSPVLLAAIIFGNRNWADRLSLRVLPYLQALYLVGAIFHTWEVVAVFRTFPHNFRNEFTILITSILLVLGALGLLAQHLRSQKVVVAIAGLVLAQLALALGAGYTDGKRIYNGASPVMFLDNKDLCDANNPNEWVYISQYGNRTFFLHTVDKRICIRESKDFMLRPR